MKSRREESLGFKVQEKKADYETNSRSAEKDNIRRT